MITKTYLYSEKCFKIIINNNNRGIPICRIEKEEETRGKADRSSCRDLHRGAGTRASVAEGEESSRSISSNKSPPAGSAA